MRTRNGFVITLGLALMLPVATLMIAARAGKEIKPCDVCNACLENGECIIRDDFSPVFDKMVEANGIILASPVYFGSCTALLKALMERAGWPTMRGRVR